ncbi:MAG: menaquinone biosynthesis methyltransferase [Acidimicrobiaceae bacterium]|nr:menaquinone biosynthesis methyltransferase [Acidimicrobiaceae bacterium]
MVREMFDAIAPRYDLVNRLMSLGMDRGWRRRAIGLLQLAPGSLILDLACGTGDVARELATNGYRTIGADLSFGMLAAARPGGAPLAQADGTALPFAGHRIDGVISGFAMRNFADLAAVLAECARVLRPGGRLGLLDVDTPTSPLLRLGHRIWFTGVVPQLGSVLSDRAAYHYLPRSVAYLPPRDELLAIVGDAGFIDVCHNTLSGGITQVITATRAGAVGLLRASARPR